MRETLSKGNLIVIEDKKETVTGGVGKQTPSVITNILSHASSSNDPSKAGGKRGEVVKGRTQ